jgi:ATP/maltotriose-dependent transcriptional regulator MalT
MEAGGGFGKSALALEFGQYCGVATALATLGPGPTDAAELTTTLRAAARAARLSDLAAALEPGDRNPPARVESLLEALSVTTEPVMLALDDVHHVTDEEAESLIHRLATGLPDPHRLLITAW